MPWLFTRRFPKSLYLCLAGEKLLSFSGVGKGGRERGGRERGREMEKSLVYERGNKQTSFKYFQQLPTLKQPLCRISKNQCILQNKCIWKILCGGGHQWIT